MAQQAPTTVLQKDPLVTNPAPAINAPSQASTKTSRVTVILPAEARLWVDAVECPLTSTVRSFDTPPLNSNQQYFYNLRVELARDGQNISETQRVLITPGKEARIDFNSVGALRTVAR